MKNEQLLKLEKAIEEGRLIILPEVKKLQDDDQLCEFCELNDLGGPKLTPNGPFLGCEGSNCKEAYDSYLENAQDSINCQFYGEVLEVEEQ